MKKFEGFPARTEYTALPNIFFSGLLPQIDDLAELKTTLYTLSMLYRKKGYPRYVSYQELLANDSLMAGLKTKDESPELTLQKSLEKAVGRGTLLSVAVEKDSASEDVYFLNTVSNRQVIEQVENGEVELAGLKTSDKKYVPPEEVPDIFTLYEENIGILTPMIADELREAEKLYPVEWINDAVKEAVLYNKRNIKYILKILENWAAEGKSDGTHQRHPQKTDPDKYIKGKYGHMVRR
jgi:DnaD/phage-associated family protein